jgi:hypothetical protein
MPDFIEIDFLAVETLKSGDAIPIRSVRDGVQTVYVVDGGYTDTSEKILNHVRSYYANALSIDHVVLTHPDGDHARGLKGVLEGIHVQRLWMNRPWLYADELLHRFPTYQDPDRLRSRLRSIYSNVAELESLALSLGIPIFEVFQGSQIGEFRVLSPSRATYLDLIVESERTPEGAVSAAVESLLGRAFAATMNFVKGAWGEERWSSQETSAENEMSIVQFANFEGTKILLTGDAGRRAMSEAADYAPFIGLALPGIDRFQVPHHGSRRNLSTEICDRWLGQRHHLPSSGYFQAFISSAKEDKDHPRKVSVRAMRHRGGDVYCTEGVNIGTAVNAPVRDGWVSATPASYPEDQEE